MLRWKSACENPRIVATALVALGGVTIFLVNFPGSMEFDSFVQLAEARARSYADWHPAVMSWLLGVYDALPGPVAGWFIGIDMLMAFGALAALLWLPQRVSWAAVGVAGAALLLPQLVLSQAVVWKDTLFADAALLATVLIGFGVTLWRRRRLRLALIGGAAVLLALAVLTRQNGIVIVPILAAGLGYVAARLSGRWRAGAAYGAGLFAAVAVLAVAGQSALLLRWDGTPSRDQQLNVLKLYDITGMVRRDPSLPLAVFDREAPGLAKLVRSEGVKLWSPLRNDTMEIPPIVDAIETVPPPVYTRQWRALIAARPGLYLAVRAELFRWVFQAPEVKLCHPIHVGDQPGEEKLEELVIVPRMDAHDIALKHYGEFFLYHTPVFSHALYALLGVAVLVLLLRRRTPADLVLAALVGSSLAFAATFAVISIACDYRYLYLVDLSALAGALYVAADWRGLFKRP